MITTSTLYTIPNEWEVILQKIAEADGELTPEIEQEIEALLKAAEFKVSNAILARRNLELHNRQQHPALCQGLHN